MAYINENQVLFSAQFNGIVTIDDAMSDESENPVQNKVVKQYIDAHSGGSGGTADMDDYVTKNAIYELYPEMYGSTIPCITSPSAVVHYVNDYAELKKKWSAIDTITLTEAVRVIEVTTPFAENKYTGVIIEVLVASGSTYSDQKARIDIKPKSQKFGTQTPVNILSTNRHTKLYYEFKNGMWQGWWQSPATSDSSTTHSMNNINQAWIADDDYVEKVSVHCYAEADKFPEGTKINIWGLK